MRVMLMIKGDPQPGAAPSEELLGAMAGTTTAQRGRRARRPGGAAPERHGEACAALWGEPRRHRGAVRESKQLIAGYWILQVQSMEEAVEWAERFPFEAWSRIYPGEYGAEVEIEIRQVFEPESQE